MLYFAYGSNLFPSRLRRRCPSARFRGAAAIDGYRLVFHKIGRDGTAKADFVEDGASVLHGALCRIAGEDEPSLDRAEGRGTGYRRIGVEVYAAGERTPAETYRALRVDDSLLPFDWYVGYVIAGAREHGLPAEWIRDLEQHPVIVDDDATRRDRHWAVIREPT